MSDLDAKLWIAMFRNASDDDLLRALAEHVRSGNKFAPNAGEIAALCGLSGHAFQGVDEGYKNTYLWMKETVERMRAEALED